MQDPSPPRPRGRRREHAGRPPRERGERGPHGLGPFGPFGFGGGSYPQFPRFPFGRGPTARRGDVRAAALLLLAETPRNGYQLMQEIESRTNGLWRPSPGSMYPVLQQLEDEGLVRPEGPESRRFYQLTDAGRRYVEEHGAELGSPWQAVCDSVGENARDFHTLIVQVIVAARQVAQVGSVPQVDEAERVLVNARRSLYRILAEDGDGDDDSGHEEQR